MGSAGNVNVLLSVCFAMCGICLAMLYQLHLSHDSTLKTFKTVADMHMQTSQPMLTAVGQARDAAAAASKDAAAAVLAVKDSTTAYTTSFEHLASSMEKVAAGMKPATAVRKSSLPASGEGTSDELIDSFEECYNQAVASIDWPDFSDEDKDVQLHEHGEGFRRSVSESRAISKCGGFATQSGLAKKTLSSLFSDWKSQLQGGDDVKVLVYTPEKTAGLGNRLQGLLSSFMMAFVTDRVLLVKWGAHDDTEKLGSNEESSMVSLDKLFDVPFVWDAEDSSFASDYPAGQRALQGGKVTYNFNGHANRGHGGDGGDYGKLLCDNLGEKSETHMDVQGYDFFGPLIQANQQYHDQITRTFGHNPFAMLFDNLFPPAQPVRDIIKGWKSIFSEHYVIGLQIRVLGKRVLPKDEHWLYRAALWLETRAVRSQSLPVLFYVATDTPACFERAKKVLGPDRVRSASLEKNALNRNSESGLQYGVVDMTLLGEADELVICPESTYGGVAVGRAGKTSWHLTKNPEDLEADQHNLIAPAGDSPCSYGWQFAQYAKCYNKNMMPPQRMNQNDDMCRTY